MPETNQEALQQAYNQGFMDAKDVMTNIFGATQSLAPIGAQVKISLRMIQVPYHYQPITNPSWTRRRPIFNAQQRTSHQFPAQHMFNQQHRNQPQNSARNFHSNQASRNNQERYIAAEFRPQNRLRPEMGPHNPPARIHNRYDQNTYPRMSFARPDVRCYRCRALGHMSRECLNSNQPKNY